MRPQDLEILCKRLNRRARRLGLGAADADDLVQETVLRLLLTLADQPLQTPDRYALVTLRNLVRTRWRRQRPTVALEDHSATVGPVAEARLSVAALGAAIGRLPPDQARLLQMIVAGDSSPAEMARALDLPLGTVMSRLARARARLRDDIGLPPGAPVAELL